MKSILFVCAGNTCRSPMAEYVLRDMLKKAGKDGKYRISSAGLGACDGNPVSAKASAVLRDHGYMPDAHRSRRLRPACCAKADRVIVMEGYMLDAISSLCGDLADCGMSCLLPCDNIPDPHGGELSDYEEAYCRIYAGCERLMQEL